MKKIYLFLIVFLFPGIAVVAQNQKASKAQLGTSKNACVNCARVMNGSDTLLESIRMDSCGLNYTTASIKLSQRVPQPGSPQPADLDISGIPCNFAIVKAYVWASSSGTGIPFNIDIINPQGVNSSHPVTQIGSGPDKCWGFQGTYSYRGDVTSAITGNGTYTISGVPVTSSDDIDGLTMMIIYKDLLATYEGHIVIADGASVELGFPTTQSIVNINACDTSTFAKGFMAVGDMQNIGSVYSIANQPPFTAVEDWWDYFDTTIAPIVPSVNTSSTTLVTNGDCYNMVMIGVYYQTTSCNVCIPQATQTFPVQTTGTQGCPGSLASATATPNGGQAPYSYTWQPGGQTTSTATNLPPGNYIVYVTDSGGCALGSDTITIQNYPAPQAQFTLSPADQASFPGQLCMTDATAGSTNWLWTVDGTTTYTTPSACYSLQDTGQICVRLFVSDANGCSDTAEACIAVVGEGIISMPNIFTPNADGVNDLFIPTFSGMKSIKCTIYNRWGAKVYEWDGLTGSWNGTTSNNQEAADGVYYYTLTAVDIQDKEAVLQGFVHLIREK